MVTADVTIPGPGDVVVDVEDHLEIDVSGSGMSEYLGTPIVESNITGLGSVNPQ